MARQTDPVFLGLRWYTIASLWFLTSDYTLAYTKFVLKSEYKVLVMVTYYGSLLFFTMAGLETLVCTDCAIQKDSKKQE